MEILRPGSKVSIITLKGGHYLPRKGKRDVIDFQGNVPNGVIEHREEPELEVIHPGPPKLMENEAYAANGDEDNSSVEEDAVKDRVATRFSDRFEQIQEYYASLNAAGPEQQVGMKRDVSAESGQQEASKRRRG